MGMINGSWKTTVAGILGGLVLAFGPQIGGRLQGDPATPPITFQNYAPALFIALMGLLAKDKDKTNSPTPVPAHPVDVAVPVPAPVASNPNFPTAR